MQTPIVYGDYLYTSKDNGVLTCLDNRKSDPIYRLPVLPGRGFTASPLAGDGKLYFTSESGEVVVIKPGPEYETLAVKELDEVAMATPAITHGVFGTHHHLVALGEPAPE